METPVPEEGPVFQLSNLYLKKIVKENHGHAIKQLKFCELFPNLLASVGGTQASIYDNENGGEHLDITMNFVNMDTPALLRVLAVCEAATRKEPLSVQPQRPSTSMDISTPLPTDLPISNATEQVQNATPIKLSEESKMQLHAMRTVVDEGGFDEDIHVGARQLGIFPSKLKAEGGVRGASGIAIGKDSPMAASEIVQNKRLMQGAGRDVELFDREDRKLKCCAWVAFPPSIPLSSVKLHRLREKLHSNAVKDETSSFNTNSYNGAADVDPSRVDMTDTWLAVAGNDGLVQLLSIAYSKVLYVLPGHCEPIIALASGQSSTCLASLSRNYIIIWNLPLIARHHYNSFHYGGPGLEDICDGETSTNSTWMAESDTLASPFSDRRFWPDHVKRLPAEYSRWILQVIPTPSRFLTTLEFAQFGLVAGSSTGHIYCWPFVPRSESFAMPPIISPPPPSVQSTPSEISATNETDDSLPGRLQSGKRPFPGSAPRASALPIWTALPRSIIFERPTFFDWPDNCEYISGMVRKNGTVESPTHGLAVRTTTGRLVVFAPKPFDIAILRATSGRADPILRGVEILGEFRISGSSAGLTQTTLNNQARFLPWDTTVDIRAVPKHPNQGLDVSSCGRFAMLGHTTGDAYIVDLVHSTLISKLEHKRSKFDISACILSHHLKTAIFASDAILWRWDYISPSFLQKERAEQAQAEAEGVDIASNDSDDEPADPIEANPEE